MLSGTKFTSLPFSKPVKRHELREIRESIQEALENVTDIHKMTQVCSMTTHTHGSLHNIRLIMASPLPSKSFPHLTIQFHL